MQQDRTFKIAENEKELIDSLFSKSSTFDGYVVKRNKRSAVVFLLGKQYTLNKYGVVCNMRKLDTGETWYSYQTDFTMKEESAMFDAISTGKEYSRRGCLYSFK